MLLSVYNTPTTFDSLPHLQKTLNTLVSRNMPTLIMIDSNLHHRLWNPPQYQHSHPESRHLLKMCRKKGFTLIFPKNIPTFFGTTGQPTTINLIWASHIALNLNQNQQPVLGPSSHNHKDISARSHSKAEIKTPLDYSKKTRP
ncbi:hypothetical protein O181_040660 [Austropuccinia psidii MF-1]|uniref:Endonuclease/exonuclease/phosphatase domain-containing protein n=1 Tax=Austropuccinia psidii MF-1 TaxID=1389203 RepID=A0A9Q3DH70_9BASI|nr:hypothetical protein [Austropuccinia psidii MF-1]